MPLPVTYTPDEVAAALGVKRRWLMEAAASDLARFPSVKRAGRVHFTEDQVHHILQAATRQAPTQPARELTQAERAAQAWGRPPPRRPPADRRPDEWRWAFEPTSGWSSSPPCLTGLPVTHHSQSATGSPVT